MTTRRTLLRLIGAGLVAPRLAFAQPARPVTVAVLFAGDSDEDEPAARPFFDEMRRLGWIEGQNIAYERLSGRGTREYVAGLARSAADLEPQLIYATTATTALAALKATESVPIVFTTASDPVAIGLVASLARPGRNATGAYQFRSGVVAQRWQLMREAFPRLARAGAVFDRRAVEFQRQRTMHQQAARQAGLELAAADFTNFEAVAKIFANFRREGIRMVVVTPSFTLVARRFEVGKLALRNGLALVAYRADWAEAGALMTYGADVAESLTRSAGLADRILRGARPADTPVEQATKFELVINLRSANALGLTIPQSIRVRADRVIE